MRAAFLLILWVLSFNAFGLNPENCTTKLSKLKTSRKIYRELLSGNSEALQRTKINTTFPASNMYAPTPEQWLAPDREYQEQMGIRKSLYEKRPKDILKILPGEEGRVQEAAQEFLEMTANHLSTQFPNVFVKEGNTIRSIPTGIVVNLDPKSAGHPLEKLGLLIQDDVTINLKNNEGKVVMAGGFLATPTNWALQDFIGMDVHAIHAGVPEYENRLKKTVEGAVERGVRGKCIGRNNWFLVTNPELALPSYRTSSYQEPTITEANVGQNVFLRSELESIVNLPKTGATIFTIRPRVWSLDFVKANAPEVAKNLGNAIKLPESGYSEMEWTQPLLKFLGSPSQ